MSNVIVHHKTTHTNREVETHTVDPRGGRWYWFVGQASEEGWTHEYDVEEAHDDET